MLNVLAASRRTRAVVVGNPPTGAALVTDDKLKIVRFTFDTRNKTALIHLAFGSVQAGAFDESGETLQVELNRGVGRTNPLHDSTWQYLRTLMTAAGGELSIAMLEQVIVDRQLLSEVTG